MIIRKPSVRMDLSRSAFLDAAYHLKGVDYKDLLICCGRSSQGVAHEISAEYKCEYVVVADEILLGPGAWSVEHARGVYWCEGLDDTWAEKAEKDRATRQLTDAAAQGYVGNGVQLRGSVAMSLCGEIGANGHLCADAKGHPGAHVFAGLPVAPCPKSDTCIMGAGHKGKCVGMEGEKQR